MAPVIFTVLFVALFYCEIWCAQVIPERAGVLYINKKYIREVKFFVKRYTRRGNYYLNLDGYTEQPFNNNLTVHIDFYELLHNEYKRSFVEMHFKLCDMVNKDPYVGKAFANAGMPCPLPQGEVIVHNITIPMNDFPNVWPFERSKADVKCFLTATNELALHLEAYIYFKNREEISKYSKKKTKQN